MLCTWQWARCGGMVDAVMGDGERLRAAVVGCGAAGVYNHIAWYATHPGVELAGLVDADPNALRLRRRSGVDARITTWTRCWNGNDRAW